MILNIESGKLVTNILRRKFAQKSIKVVIDKQDYFCLHWLLVIYNTGPAPLSTVTPIKLKTSLNGTR